MFSFLPRGAPKNTKDQPPKASPRQAEPQETQPDSRWGTPEATGEDLSYPPRSKIFLGSWNGQYVGIADDRHHLVIAGSRGGKGTSVIVPNLIGYAGSMLVIDPKGENANMTALKRSADGQDVHVIAPYGKVGRHISDAGLLSSFNPLSMLSDTSSTLFDDAGLIADALVVPSGGDSHWDDSAQNFIQGVILHVMTWSTYDSMKDLLTVSDLIFEGTEFDGKTGLDGLKDEMRLNQACDGAVSSAAVEFFEKSTGERDSVLSSARKHLSFCRSEAMRSVLRADSGLRSVDLRDLKRKPSTVFLCLPASHMGANRRWLRLFVNLTMQALENTPAYAPDAPPVVLLLDEFPVLGYMRQIEDAAGLIAGFGVKLMIIIQDLSQLKSLYRERWETFVGNAGVVQCFSNTETTTTEWISKKLGQCLIVEHEDTFVSVPNKVTSGDTGNRTRKVLAPLLAPDEVARLFAREHNRQILMINGKDAIPLARVNWYEDENFRDYVDERTEL